VANLLEFCGARRYRVDYFSVFEAPDYTQTPPAEGPFPEPAPSEEPSPGPQGLLSQLRPRDEEEGELFGPPADRETDFL
jgi:hypothetical protein